jgi:hypothetical protein
LNEPKKQRTFADKLRDTLIIYVLPICIVGYVNYTKCWPYNAINNFYKGTAGERAKWINSDMIYFFSVVILGGIFYGIRYVYKKIIK